MSISAPDRPDGTVRLSVAVVRGMRVPAWASVLGPYLAVVAIAGIWLVSLRSVRLGQMDDLGIVGVLPPLAFASLALLTISFSLTLRRPEPPVSLLLFHLVVLIVMVYGVTGVIEDEPRFAAAWRHIGVTESISRTENVDPLIDAYFNWPGFFIFSALFRELAGIDDLSRIVAWAPVIFNLLYLAPLLVVLRAARSGEWVAWLAAWFFYLTNWIGQDYFAPQAMAFLLYLVVLGIVLRWFVTERHDEEDADWPPSPVPPRRWWHRWRRPAYGLAPARATPWTWLRARGARWWAAVERHEAMDVPTAPSPHVRAAVMAIAIVLIAAVVAGHQLTPFALLLTVTSLVVARRCSARRLPIVIVALITTWLSFVAVTYLRGHVETLLENFGQVEQSVGANVGGRLAGSADHELIVRMRLGVTGLLWMAALVGGIWQYRRGRLSLAFAILALAPLGLVGMQSYGGEVLLRAYLFGLPFVAYFVASPLAPHGGRAASWLRAAAVAVVSAALLTSLLFTRYGNERMDYYTPSEVAAVKRVYEVAEPGAVLFAASASLPWKFQDYERFDYEVLTDSAVWQAIDPERPRVERLAVAAARHVSRSGRETYLIVTRSQRAQLEMLGYPPTLLDHLDRALSRSPRFVVLYRNADATVWRLRQTAREHS